MNDMGRCGKCLFGGPPIAVLGVERQIVKQFFMQPDSPLGDRRARLHRDREVFIFNLDTLRGILCQVLRIGDNQCNGFSDKANTGMRQSGTKWNAKRTAVDPFEERSRRRAFPARGDQIVAGQNVENAWHCPRMFRVDPHYFRVGPIAAHKMRSFEFAEGVIGGVKAPAGDQAGIFPAALELMLGQS